MPSASLDFPACISCNFSPFCLAGKTKQHCQEHVHPTVKQQLTLKRKDILCLPKKKFQSLYAVQKGALKTFQAEANGKEVIRGFYFAGEILGYEAIYTGHYLTSAVALTETLVCEIPYNNFLTLLNSMPELQEHTLNLISQQLSMGSYVSSPTAEQRLAAFLVDMRKRLHPREKRQNITLPMSRQDIGNYLNLTAETISRLFSRLQKLKVITVKDKRITLLQPEKLQQIAEGLEIR